MSNTIPYKSFCWSLGTTSFRTKNFNKTIEEQLSLLDEFWNIPENTDCEWSGNKELQIRYYDFMFRKEFVEGSSNNKAKDAREKTSGLVDIGLINEERKITLAGMALLDVSKSNVFSTNNFFQIPRDSFIYLKQLLKTSNNVNGKCIRPFIVLLYVLSKLEYLTMEEFTYLLPLCTDEENIEFIIQQIEKLRAHDISIDSIIIDRLMTMDNYKAGLELLLKNDVNEDIICTVGINRKSRDYDKPYFLLYNELYNVFIKNDKTATINLLKATKKVKIGVLWRGYLFDTIAEKAIKKEPEKHLNATIFSTVKTVEEFKKAFYKMMHLFKAKATLSDYFDLNRRYIKTTDIILFEDDTVKLDIVAKYFFYSIVNKLYKSAFVPSSKLFDDCKLEEIDNSIVIHEKVVINGINNEFNTNIKDISEAYMILEKNRYQRLHHLIDNKFTDDKILILLDLFKERKDSEINSMVTDNADIPTIFEYVLGIIWYKISNQEGKVLDYMNLSLDADLLPKTHAGGGEADITYEYEKTKYYPRHTLLIEATLADKTNQRCMEMEPVSRHLGQHLLSTNDMNSYCIFITNSLHINVISDFRSRKTTIYYDSNDYSKYINGMKIIPLQTDVLKDIISKNKKYKELYNIFEKAYQSDLKPLEWYREYIGDYQ